MSDTVKYIVEKQTPSGRWVRVTPKWSRAECFAWLSGAVTAPSPALMRVVTAERRLPIA
jgi:hypothetical protein